jgi:hypothetical protein
MAVRYPSAERINQPLAVAFSALDDGEFDRRTHFIDGRFENLYLPAARLPGLAEIVTFAEEQARRYVSSPLRRLRCGFWLNAMAPGQTTSRHSHEENDELVSAVYYVTAPPASGDILFHDDPFEIRVKPQAGMLLLFAPSLAHSVEANKSERLRLSVAFNFGADG